MDTCQDSDDIHDDIVGQGSEYAFQMHKSYIAFFSLFFHNAHTKRKKRSDLDWP